MKTEKSDVKEIIRTAGLLFLICAVCAALLGGINLVTAPKITEASEAAAQKSRTQVLPSAVSFEEITLNDGTAAWKGTDANGTLTGYVFSTYASSYGGKLNIMTGITVNGTVSGISVLSISDTPGLGLNAKKDSFKEQFQNTDDTLTVIKNGTAGKNQIQAISSATITSNAVTSCVNQAREYFNALSAENGGSTNE